MRNSLKQRDALPGLVDALGDWFSHKQRVLPWRGAGATPYRVWVSEIMLQQTQVAKVVPYFERFVERFADVYALASAPLNEVLAEWAGLGYYSRGRLLHRAAATLVNEPAAFAPLGEDGLPLLADGWARLPGIGRYTLGAVRSIAYQEPLPIVDGNVVRVLSRVFGKKVRRGDPVGERTLWPYAEALVASTVGTRWRPGDLNQSLMELGALVCTPRQPACEACPLRTSCVANASGDASRYPLPKLKVARKPLELWVAKISVNDKILLCQRPPRGLWASMWVLPFAETESALKGVVEAMLRTTVAPLVRRNTLKRTLTHKDLTLHLMETQRLGRAPSFERSALPPAEGVRFAEQNQLHLPRAFSALLEAAHA